MGPAGFPAGCWPESCPREEPGAGCTWSSSSLLSFTTLPKQQHLNLVLHLIPSLEEASGFHRPGTGCRRLAARSEPDRAALTPRSSTLGSGMSHRQPPEGLLDTPFRSHKKLRGLRGAHLSPSRDPLPSLHSEELQQTTQARISAAQLLSVRREPALLVLRIPIAH